MPAPLLLTTIGLLLFICSAVINTYLVIKLTFEIRDKFEKLSKHLTMSGTEEHDGNDNGS